MNTTVYSPRSLARPPAEAIITLGFLFASLCGLVLYNRALTTAYFHAVVSEWVPGLYILPAIGLAFASYYWRMRYVDFSSMLRFAMRSSAAGLLAYLILEPIDYTVAVPGSEARAFYVNGGYYVAVLVSAVSLWRPSFIVPTCIFISSTRLLVESISGLPISTLDIRYMLDMAAYLSFIGIILVRVAAATHPFFRSENRQIEITCVAFGLHLGNYFWSGIAKLAVGPHFWTWILENPTYATLAFAIENGTLPIGHIPWLTDFASKVMQTLIVPLNFLIVATQLFALICIVRLLWLKVASIAYDFLHVGIWIFGGLFFWPWVWNNITILIAAQKQRAPIPTIAKIACIMTILLGSPSLPFQKSAWLGWFDASAARQTYFEAVTDNGAYRIPSSFFLSNSYSVSHGYMHTAPRQGHYAHTWWNSVYDYGRHKTTGTCPEPPNVDPNAIPTDEARKAQLERVRRFILAHHLKMTSSNKNFYLRVHHHASNPFLFKDFNRLNLSRVTGYNLVVESVCHGLENGRLVKQVVFRSADHFDAR